MYSATPQSLVTTSTQAGRHRYVLVIALLSALAMLAGCASRSTQAPVTDMSGGPAASAPASGTYVVRPGDTLYQIAQRHGIDVATLVRLNNISDPSQLRVGQTLRLSGSAPAGSPAPTSVATPTPVTPVTPSEPPTPTRASDANLISWDWPAGGKIIQGFNTNTKGIDIEGSVGDSVVAAASGKVMYAGNGVRGLGNLILLGHSNGFITAYAHNDRLLVKSGDSVSKGDKIALLGQTDTSSPRLHFEIRRSGTPVNPLSYLPKR